MVRGEASANSRLKPNGFELTVLLFMPNVSRVTNAGCTYVSKGYHRNAAPEKAQWLPQITVTTEIAIFVAAYNAHNAPQRSVWGYHQPNGLISPLGVSPSNMLPQVELFLAKFNEQLAPPLWSGYPADYRRKPQDRPPATVLQLWHRNGLIAKHEISRIRSGKPCSLSR